MTALQCAHCGLPVTASRRSGGATGQAEAGSVYCCYGCYLISRIVGRQHGQSVRAWNLLRLGVGAFLAMDVMMVSLLLYTGGVEAEAVPAFRWVLLGLATPVMLLVGLPFLRGAARELLTGRANLNVLIALGAFAAYLVSAANTVRRAGPVYFDTATMLPTLVLFGLLVEAAAKASAADLRNSLESLLPMTASRVEPAGDREVPLSELRAGDRVRVSPGQRIPVDGRVVSGASVIEEAAFTGEPLPRTCREGDEVFAGTVNGPGGLVIQAERTGEGLLLRRILAMVEEARGQPAPSQRLAERAAAIFVPIVLALSVAAGAAWLLSAGAGKAGFAALSVLVVACPCAMGIATPLATAVAIARAARGGVLVRGGAAMERAGAIDALVFDKTGTLTQGRPTVRSVQILDPSVGEQELLTWLASLEAGSTHPLARAIVEEARRRGLELGQVAAIEELPGFGIRGAVSREGLLRHVQAGADGAVNGAEGTRVTPNGLGSVVSVAWDDGLAHDDPAMGRPTLRGRVILDDPVRPEAAEAVGRLRRAGVAVELLSGDRAGPALAAAEQAGIDPSRVLAPCRPEEKVASLHRLAEEGLTVGMVGDGINDAPALAAAHVGFALGAGADLARQSGDVVLPGNDLRHIPWLIDLSRRTRRIIRQNLAWAFAYNAVALSVAATGWLHPLLAALAMVASSLTLLANSLRLGRFPGPKASQG